MARRHWLARGAFGEADPRSIAKAESHPRPCACDLNQQFSGLERRWRRLAIGGAMPEPVTGNATLARLRSQHAQLTDIRHDIHAHPELGLETHRTADIVARLLKSWGIEVHR